MVTRAVGDGFDTTGGSRKPQVKPDRGKDAAIVRWIPERDVPPIDAAAIEAELT